MADKEDQPEALSGEEALVLARKGKEAWNAWAMKSEGRKVDFSGVNFTIEKNNDISFEGFTFPGDVDFRRATFMEARFKLATFRGRAEFQRTVFNVYPLSAAASAVANLLFDRGASPRLDSLER